VVARKHQIMTPVEAIRKRPGMYVGEPDYRAFLHILGEVLNQCRELIILTGSGPFPPFKDRVPRVALEVSISDLRVDVALEWSAPKFEPLPGNIELLFLN
jgi:hypothetical protein